jgi:hypothetical protein
VSEEFGELTPIKIYEDSRNDPDVSPKKPPPKGMWTWWRTGEHPKGVWVVLDWTTNPSETSAAYRKNEAAHPVPQDAALGEPSDFGNVVCHACGEMSEGYPEPRHKTECDGKCRWGANGRMCSLHKRRIENAQRAEHERELHRPVAERIADGSLDEQLALIYYAVLVRYGELKEELPDG